MRLFSGTAAPPPVIELGRGTSSVYLDSFFPNAHDPFAINRSLMLGEGGYGLAVVDRGLAGLIPDPRALWPLNMVPFGVAFNGTILDPSGPWFDGGPADPRNPFDRRCSGWEYEVNDPRVMDLVGVPPIVQGHVQPSGLFHYHGYSPTLVQPLRQHQGETDALQLLGYSADGYPIIDCRLRDKDGRPVRLVSGYRLRTGARAPQGTTDPALTPPGRHDGLYVQDYVYAPRPASEQGGARVVPLDQRNGLVLGGALPALPGFPPRHYAYAITADWPQIPRFFAHRPHDSFAGVIPLDRMGRPGRRRLYTACGADADQRRGLGGRHPY